MTPVCSADAGAPPAREWMSTRAQIVIASCACAGATAFLYAVNPSQHAVYPQCWFYHATGLYCAGCGATRALHALLHGRFVEAAHDNVLFIGMLPWIAGLSGLYLIEAWRKKAWPSWELQPRLLMRSGAWIFLLMVLFMVARNLPGWPFEAFRPVG